VKRERAGSDECAVVVERSRLGKVCRGV
jgi:hypothetical protein